MDRGIKKNADLNSQWIVEVNIYEGLQNPFWVLKTGTINKLIKMLKKLPLYKNGIPDLIKKSYKGCVLFNMNNQRIVCGEGYVMIYDNNMIEIKEDCDYTVENEILRAAPENIYKEVCHFL